MRIFGNLLISVVLCVILLRLCKSQSGIRLRVGPFHEETGKYVYKKYTSTGVDSQHCRYCPKGAFKDTAANIRTQEPSCIAKYDNIMNEITPFERENFKIPICKIGEIPGCGPPTEEKKTADFVWSCDPGFSNVNYSVYFSCALIHKTSGTVAWTYYCNESLLWEVESNNFTGVSSKVDAANGAVLNGSSPETSTVSTTATPSWAVSLLDDIKIIKAALQKFDQIEKSVNFLTVKVSEIETKVKVLESNLYDSLITVLKHKT